MKKPRRARMSKWLSAGLPSALLVAGLIGKVADVGVVEELQQKVFDQYQRMRPRPYEDVPVRIIDIDDESLEKLGQMPWPRTLFAKLVDRAKEAGVGALAFDIVFAEPDRTSPKKILPLWPQAAGELSALAARLPDHDEVFARSIAKAPVVAGMVLGSATHPKLVTKAAFSVSGESPASFVPSFDGAVVNLPGIEKAAKGVGSFNMIPEADGIVRRVPLLFAEGETTVPSLAAEALRVAQNAANISVKTAGGSGEASFGARTGIAKLKIGNLEMPTDELGRLWVYYSEDAPARTIPAWQVLDPKFDRSRLKGVIAFVGTSAAGLKDQRPTPLDPVAPGVQIHAQVAEQALSGRFLRRPDWATGLEAVFLLVFGTLMIFFLDRAGAAWGAIVSLGGVALATAASWACFTRLGWLLDPVFPAIIVLLVYFSSSILSYLRAESERRQVRGAFGRYLSPTLVEQLAANPDKLKLGGESRVMTFHFCDIQGFSTISEFYDPLGLIRFLNKFLTPMTEIILNRKGSIDKYIGDCIMAYWNAPIDDPDHAKNACLAVLEMHAALKDVNAEREAEAKAEGKKFMPIRIRTGLNSGPCIVGNMGSEQRFDYSVLGDDVNIASRLEGANKFFHTYIMVSETTIAGAGDSVEHRELGRIRVVGKSTPVKVYELLAKKGELSEEWRTAREVYHKGLELFHDRKFEEALAKFQEVLGRFPDDGPARTYATMASDYAHIPPPDDWDGVFNLTAK
jgi:adenylate cyclase